MQLICRWTNLAALRRASSDSFGFGGAVRKLPALSRQGVVQDRAEALKWCRLAADQGVADAQYNLGLKYANGRGVPQDYVEAHKWLNLAAAQSDSDNQEELVEARDSLAEQMTPAQIAEAQRLAREWKPKTWDALKKGLD